MCLLTQRGGELEADEKAGCGALSLRAPLSLLEHSDSVFVVISYQWLEASGQRVPPPHVVFTVLLSIHFVCHDVLLKRMYVGF